MHCICNFIVTLKKAKKDKSTADRNATVSKYVSLHVYSESAIKWILECLKLHLNLSKSMTVQWFQKEASKNLVFVWINTLKILMESYEYLFWNYPFQYFAKTFIKAQFIGKNMFIALNVIYNVTQYFSVFFKHLLLIGD